MEFFRRTPAYTGLPNLGTGYLAAKLEHHLVNGIRRQLPIIASAVDKGCASRRLAMGRPHHPGFGSRAPHCKAGAMMPSKMIGSSCQCSLGHVLGPPSWAVCQHGRVPCWCQGGPEHTPH